MDGDEGLFGDAEGDGEWDTQDRETHEWETQGDGDAQEWDTTATTTENVQVPNTPAPSQNVLLVRVPSFLAIEATAFDAATFIPGQTSLERLRVQNTIRWHVRSQRKRSNARLVRWDDGSLSLLIGEELFDATLSQLSSDKLELLAVMHPLEELLQTRARFSHSLAFRPLGTHSHTHRKLMLSIADKHKKENKTKVISTTTDPLLSQIQAEKLDDEKYRNKRKLENKRQELDYSRYSRRHDPLPFSSIRNDYYDNDNDDDDDDNFIDDDLDDNDNHLRLQNAKLPEKRSISHFQDHDDDDDDLDLLADQHNTSMPSEIPTQDTKRKRMRIDVSDDEEDNDHLSTW